MMNNLYYIKIDEHLDKSIFDNLVSMTSPIKKQKIHSFKFDIEKKLSIFSDVLIRYFACKTLNLTNKDIQFANNGYGKPYLMNHPTFQYNISHTKNAILVGVSDKAIGVDIEKIKQSDLMIAKRFFTSNEIEYVLSNSNNQDKLFYEIWTKKEAYIKWVGKGLSIPLKSFDVTSDELKVKISTFQIDDYRISICSDNEFKKVHLFEISEQELIEILNGFYVT